MSSSIERRQAERRVVAEERKASALARIAAALEALAMQKNAEAAEQ